MLKRIFGQPPLSKLHLFLVKQDFESGG